ncbi:response regulator [Facklamia sp. 7083-14-GEN3]|uniref:response regulator n=1 Tax=Facklamia sp. 7083-14-GEN3 TaxID=2973478 RepID=UPI00215C8C6D|nr:GHKL domain-containing protein [Facklamia sp. 7083-14-GEN3]MCR8969800.1 GHKL domain-containing protein [Facklamia sp. 7083-14-GEN3]
MRTVQIVLADDEAIQRKNMAHMLETACQKLQIKPIIACYESGEAFLFHLEDHHEWQIAFLDIEMAEMTGMELAHQLREKAPYLKIIFATAYAEYAVEGYQVDALDFLLKPINQSAVERVLTKFLQLQPKSEKFVVVEDLLGKKHAFELDDLILVEVNKRQLRLVLASQEIFISGPLAHFKEDLDQHFVAPHRSYLINLNHVESIGKEEVLLSSGDRVLFHDDPQKRFKKRLLIIIKEVLFMIKGLAVGLLIALLVIFYYIYLLRRELKFHQLQQKELDNYALEVESVYRQMRGIRHDYRNHLQVVQAYLNGQDYRSLDTYLQELTNEMNQVDTIIRTGNTLIDALVNTKLSRAQSRGVEVHASAIAPSKLSVNSTDLAVILGNLLNNALEATANSNNQKAAFIRLYIAPLKNTFYISLQNSMDQKPRQGFLSLKGANRQGYGLKRIDEAVNKNQVIVNRQWEEGVFATEVTLPLKN